MWGCSNAQIFSEVSPDMHWEFAHSPRPAVAGALGPHLLRLLRAPGQQDAPPAQDPEPPQDLRVSPWNDFAKVVDGIRGDYVFSFKPSPAIFVEEPWNPGKARAYMKDVLDKARGVCHVEMIMKDVSTVCYRPQNLWDWARIAMEVADEYA